MKNYASKRKRKKKQSQFWVHEFNSEVALINARISLDNSL